MENKNFYPLRVGNHVTVIVTDTYVYRPNAMRDTLEKMQSEVEHYGGFIIAESIPPGIAQELVDAYNEKYAPKEGFGTTVEDLSDEKLGHNPLINDLELDNAQANSKATIEDRFATVTIDQQIKFIRNSRHSILGSDDAIYSAILHNLESIKRWNESPVYHGKIDVAKVIFDLMDAINIQVDTTELVGSKETKAKFHSAFRNAEAAIEMINAFKQEREGLGTMVETSRRVGKGRTTVRPLTQEDVASAHEAGKKVMEKKPQHISNEERDQLVDEVADHIKGWYRMDNGGRLLANAIIFAIESMDHLKHQYATHGK
jgi:hypothetical protein